MDDGDDLVLNFNQSTDFSAFLKPKPKSAANNARKPTAGPQGGRKPLTTRRRDDDYDDDPGAGITLAPVTQQPRVLVQRTKHAEPAAAKPSAPSTFRFGFMGNMPADAFPAQPQPEPEPPLQKKPLHPLGANPFGLGNKPKDKDARGKDRKLQGRQGDRDNHGPRNGGNNNRQGQRDGARSPHHGNPKFSGGGVPGGQWSSQRALQEKPKKRGGVRPAAKERYGFDDDDVDEHLDNVAIDDEGLDAITNLISKTQARDRSMEGGATGGVRKSFAFGQDYVSDGEEDDEDGRPSTAAAGKQQKGRKTFVSEGEVLRKMKAEQEDGEQTDAVAFDDEEEHEGAKPPTTSKHPASALVNVQKLRKPPTAPKHVRQKVLEKFGAEDEDSDGEDDLTAIRQHELALARELPHPLSEEEEEEGDRTYEYEVEGTAAYGRAINAPSTSGRAANLEAQAARKRDMREQKKARKKAGAAEVGSRVAHKAGELVHAGGRVAGQAGQDLFGDEDFEMGGAAEEEGGAEDAAPALGVVKGEGPWTSLGVAQSLEDHLKELNFVEPTRIQRLAIPALLSGKDCLVNAPTGSGKTLSYLAPIVHDLQAQSPRVSRVEGTYAVVVSPTRELSMQISDVLTLLLRRYHWIVGGCIMGGENRTKEKARLRKGVNVLVASPGRLLDHLGATQAFRTDHLRWLILDEADRLLDLGFEAKLKEIVDLLDKRKAEGEGSGARYRRVLLSATLHSELARLAAVSLHKPVSIGFKLSKEQDGTLQITAGEDVGADGGDNKAAGPDAYMQSAGTFTIPKQLRQSYVEVPAKLRLAALVGFLRQQESERGGVSKIVVFMSTGDTVEFHHKLLTTMPANAPKKDKYSKGKRGGTGSDDDEDDGFDFDGEAPRPLLQLPVYKLHGNMVQSQRMSTFFEFSRCTAGVLICTDVAARGLDFPAVTCIVQFDPPGEPSEYVHRVGRTARMGQQGSSMLFLMPSEAQYAGLLQGNGVNIHKQDLDQCMRYLPGAEEKMIAKMMAIGGGGKRQRVDMMDASGGKFSSVVGDFQYRVGKFVTSDAKMKQLAADAFRSFVRAYAVHPASVGTIFHVKKLHLGHIAGSFGLKEAPTMIGASASKEEMLKKKQEEAMKKKRMQKKAMYSAHKEKEYNVV